MKTQPLLLSMIVLCSLPFAGCDSNVTAEDGGGGAQSEGGSNDGGSVSTGGSNGSGGAGGSISGAEAVAEACSTWCEGIPQCANAGQTCEEFCTIGAPDGCAFEYAALTDCVAPFTLSDCTVPDGTCPEEKQAFDACAANAPATHCGNTSVDSSGDTCQGGGLCVNGKDARVTCSQDGNTIVCTCFVDEVQLGQCSGTDLSCDLTTGCCNQFY